MAANSNLTKQDVAKEMQKESKKHGGNIPADSYAAGLQHIVDSEAKDKDQIIEERKAGLPLPEQPPVASDFNSANQNTVNVSSSSRQDDMTVGVDDGGLREPATGGSAVREDGEAFKEHTEGLNAGRVPGGTASDAVTVDKRNQATDETRN